MPILISVDPNAPLTQGDVLKDVPLFRTAENGSAVLVKSSYVLVVSRPCNCVHKEQIVVAAIELTREAVPRDVEGFRGARIYLEKIRDGIHNPDRFYLGHNIPTCQDQGRFFARLDSLHTVEMPVGAERTQGRVARLEASFQRDLHRRLFSSFASLGFDDYQWYSDQDLNWLVTVGGQELAEMRHQIAVKKQEIARNEIGGNPERNTGSKSDLEKLEKKASGLETELRVYQAELDSRRAPGAPT